MLVEVVHSYLFVVKRPIRSVCRMTARTTKYKKTATVSKCTKRRPQWQRALPIPAYALTIVPRLMSAHHVVRAQSPRATSRPLALANQDLGGARPKVSLVRSARTPSRLRKQHRVSSLTRRGSSGLGGTAGLCERPHYWRSRRACRPSCQAGSTGRCALGRR